MSFKFFDKLSKDFSELLNDKKEYNVVIEVDKEENKKLFTAHSVVLRYRSSYFDKELENTATNENHVKTINKPNISAQIFEIILKYIYSGIINIENMDPTTIYELMIVANELTFEELSIKLEGFLVDYLASWLKTQFSLIYHSIFNYNEFKGLKIFYNDIIIKSPGMIFESENFISLQETTLVSVLKCDNLQIEEIKIWDYVIKWGIAQNPTLPTSLEKWSKENFETLKTTLQQCLPLIRYFHFSDEDIWEKVKPYKKILGKQLWEDLIQHSMFPNQPVKSPVLSARGTITPKLPPTVKKPFSNIISEEHATEISSWIDCKSTIYSSTKMPYEFQLILRGSRDGFHPRTFWDICHGYAGTVVVAKVAGTGELLGGYNPLAWDNSLFKIIARGTYMETNDSFIFSLKNDKIKNSVLSRVKDKGRALYYYSSCFQNSYGPCFGNWEFLMRSDVSDFTEDKKSWCIYDPRDCNYYEKSIRTTNKRFSIADYEVFKIIKRH
ncbi:hypothetical protein Glove_55g59 [Diversispora epigaea]|uniref:BTB domain-containing protein n=1 Tax=Diversispora epigaea TaxID=1348612 RepID=A0A397JCI0_9GLOM|nr:hypothetical protein Glove_55g59 [Diversispora epigaea]